MLNEGLNFRCHVCLLFLQIAAPIVFDKIVAKENTGDELEKTVTEKESQILVELYKEVDLRNASKHWFAFVGASLQGQLRHLNVTNTRRSSVHYFLNSLSFQFTYKWVFRLRYQIKLELLPSLQNKYLEMKPLFSVLVPPTETDFFAAISITVDKRLGIHLSLQQLHFVGSQQTVECNYGFLDIQSFSAKRKGRVTLYKFCGVHSDAHLFIRKVFVNLVLFRQRIMKAKSDTILIYVGITDQNLFLTTSFSTHNSAHKLVEQIAPFQIEWMFVILYPQSSSSLLLCHFSVHRYMRVVVTVKDDFLSKSTFYDAPEIIKTPLKPRSKHHRILEFVGSTFQCVAKFVMQNLTKLREVTYTGLKVTPIQKILSNSPIDIHFLGNVFDIFSPVLIKARTGQFVQVNITHMTAVGKFSENCQFFGLSFFNLKNSEIILFETDCSHMIFDGQFRQKYSASSSFLITFYSYKAFALVFTAQLTATMTECAGVVLNACDYMYDDRLHWESLDSFGMLTLSGVKCTVVQIYRSLSKPYDADSCSARLSVSYKEERDVFYNMSGFFSTFLQGLNRSSPDALERSESKVPQILKLDELSRCPAMKVSPCCGVVRTPAP